MVLGQSRHIHLSVQEQVRADLGDLRPAGARSGLQSLPESRPEPFLVDSPEVNIIRSGSGFWI